VTHTDISLEEWEVLDLLTSLVDKSLVIYEEDEQGLGRYRLMETVRQYAGDKMVEIRQSESLRRRHSRYFLSLAETASPHLMGPQQKQWCDHLEVEHDNLRLALNWYLTDETAPMDETAAARQDEKPNGIDGVVEQGALRLVYALHWFWWSRSYQQEGYESLRCALAHPTAQGRTRWRAHTLFAAAWFANGIAGAPTARALHDESMAVAQEVGDIESLAASSFRLGIIAVQEGEYTVARSYLERVLELEPTSGDQTWQTLSRFALGLCASAQGDFKKAHALLVEAGRMAQERGYVEGEALAVIGSGMVAFFAGEDARARTALEQGLRLLRAHGFRTHQVLALRYLALLDAMQDNYPSAYSLIEQAMEMNADARENKEHSRNLVPLALIALRQEHYGAARQHLTQCLPMLQALEMKFEMLLALEAWAALEVANRRWSRATCVYGAAAALRTRMGALTIFKAHSHYEHSVALCGDALGQESFRLAWETGYAMTIEQVVDYALGEQEDA